VYGDMPQHDRQRIMELLSLIEENLKR
jgi:hypothetical protein